MSVIQAERHRSWHHQPLCINSETVPNLDFQFFWTLLNLGVVIKLYKFNLFFCRHRWSAETSVILCMYNLLMWWFWIIDGSSITNLFLNGRCPNCPPSYGQFSSCCCSSQRYNAILLVNIMMVMKIVIIVKILVHYCIVKSLIAHPTRGTISFR